MQEAGYINSYFLQFKFTGTLSAPSSFPQVMVCQNSTFKLLPKIGYKETNILPII